MRCSRNNIASVLATAVARNPHRPAISVGSHVLHDYQTLARRSSSFGNRLREQYGLSGGERVGLVMQNTPAYAEAIWGIWWAGLVAVPLNAKLHPNEVQHCLLDAEATVCLADDCLAQALRGTVDVVSCEGMQWQELVSNGTCTADPEPVDADDLAWLFYTSGTTGRPKGAMLSHANLRAQMENYYVDIDEIGPGESILHAAPMSHGSGLYAIPHVGRGALQIFPRSGGFNASEVCEIVAQQPNESVHMFAVPTMLKRLLAAGQLSSVPAFRGLKTIAYGGGPMYVSDLERAMDAFGPGKLVQLYGQAEAPMTITALSKQQHDDRSRPHWFKRLGSVGLARQGVEVRVITQDGSIAAYGEVGEVCCRGAVVMLGYWRNERASTAALSADGWLATGDLGYMDDDGFIYLKDRSKDVIISGGANIYPREVEEVLLRHSGVLECSVIGRPSAEWGEEVVAFVVPKADGHGVNVENDYAVDHSDAPKQVVHASDLDALCLQHIARFKRPRQIIFVDMLPKNNNGKILKTELRAQLEVDSSSSEQINL